MASGNAATFLGSARLGSARLGSARLDRVQYALASAFCVFRKDGGLILKS